MTTKLCHTKMSIIFMFGVFCCLVSPACISSRKIDVKIPDGKLVFTAYASGIPESTVVLPPSSTLHVFLSTWLSNNSDGWVHSYKTFAPKYTIKDSIFYSRFYMNIWQDVVILNFVNDKGNMVQMLHPSDADFKSTVLGIIRDVDRRQQIKIPENNGVKDSSQ